MRGCITQRGNFSHHGEKIKPCPETCFGDDKMLCLLQPFGDVIAFDKHTFSLGKSVFA